MFEALVAGSGRAGGGGNPLGPGPVTTDKYFKRTDGKESAYYGLLASGLAPAAKDLGPLMGVSVSEPEWMKFLLDGKIILISRNTIASGIARSTMHARGLVYGTPGAGAYPDSSKDQNTQITVKGYTYIVRLPRISTKDTYASGDINESEWARLLWTVDRNTKASDTEAGAKWDSLNLGIPSQHSMTSQVIASNTSNAACIGYESIYSPSSLPRTSANSAVAWRPVLELVK